jgi:formate hydrogenlyase subunit 6/NADH:ubiquinone oxidoreductase subunit I
MLPDWVNGLAKKIFVKTPAFQHSTCILCGRCIEICPPQTLSFEDDEKSKWQKKVVIDKTDCIHCFCCHEICPVDAIQLKRFQ